MNKTSPSQQEFILIAQDGSQNAQNAAVTAVEIAKARQYRVQGIYVVDETLVMEGGSDFHREMASEPLRLSRNERAAQLEKHGQQALRWLETRCREASVAVSGEIALNGIPETVIDRMESAQLLAIGSRGNGHAVAPDYLGSNFKAVAHKAKIPLIVGGSEQRPLRKLLLAYNGKPHATDALAWASRLQDMLRVRVHVVTVEEDDDPARSKAWIREVKQNLFQCKLGNCQFHPRKGHAASGIVAAAKDVQADLLVMGGYRHKALLEWLVGSTVDEVLRTTVLTCLVV